MKKPKKIFLNLSACLLFAVLFAFNATSFVQNHGSESSISFISKAAAEEPGGNKKECGLDECQKQRDIGVPPFHVIQVANGHYAHCKITFANSNCNDGNCERPCDASF